MWGSGRASVAALLPPVATRHHRSMAALTTMLRSSPARAATASCARTHPYTLNPKPPPEREQALHPKPPPARERTRPPAAAAQAPPARVEAAHWQRALGASARPAGSVPPAAPPRFAAPSNAHFSWANPSRLVPADSCQPTRASQSLPAPPRPKSCFQGAFRFWWAFRPAEICQGSKRTANLPATCRGAMRPRRDENLGGIFIDPGDFHR